MFHSFIEFYQVEMDCYIFVFKGTRHTRTCVYEGRQSQLSQVLKQGLCFFNPKKRENYIYHMF